MTSAFRSSIDASVGHIAAAPATGDMPMPGGGAPPTGGGGQFSFEPDEIRAIVKDWMTLAQEYGESAMYARDLGLVQPPGDDTASGYHSEAASFSGQAYLDSLAQKQAYCEAQAQKFHDALHDYLGIEHQNIRTLYSTDQPMSGPPETSAPGGI